MKKNRLVTIRGSGGGDSGSGSRAPIEDADSLESSAYAQILDLVSEGEIEGLVNGLKSVFLDQTPLQNPDGTYNFADVVVDQRFGTQSQRYMPGNPSVENEIAVGVVARFDTPVVRSITNPNIDAVRVLLSFPQLTSSDSNTGDLHGVTLDYAIDRNENGAGWVEVIRKSQIGKSTSKYERQFRIELPNTGPYQIRVRRITPDATSVNVQDKITWSSYTEIEDVKLAYPNSALVGVRVRASQFSSIPSRAYDVKLLRIRVPTNYDPVTRLYSGSWDGTFKIAWTDNPAWCFYDLLTSTRYGLGAFIPEDHVDKWTLYTIGKYCDELVPDGFTGTEPRFTCNLYLQSRSEAYKVINDMASIFRGMVYWAGGAITASQDAPSDAAYLFSPSNVLDGIFSYAGASSKQRHTVALVSWNDPSDFYSQKVEYVEDAEGIAKFGAIETSVVAMGCTSRGQAHRLGRWLLYTEKYQSEQVTFSTGLEGAVLRPGQVIKVADPVRAGKQMAGRVHSSTVGTIVVDRDLTVGLNLALNVSVLMQDGSVIDKTVTIIAGRTLAVTPPFAADNLPQADALWMLSNAEIEPQLFRVISVLETKPGQFDVSAVGHNPSKFDAIDSGTVLEARSISSLDVIPDTPSNLEVTETLYAVGKDVRVKVTCSWTPAQGAGSYVVQYRRDAQNYVLLPETNTNEIEVLNAEPGTYTFSVFAISPAGRRSGEADVTKKVLGRGAAPSPVSNFSLIPNADMAYLSWDKAEDLDVIIGGSVRVRYTPEVDAPLWKASVDILPALPGTETRAQVPLLAGTYMAKFVDSGGVASDDEAIIVTTIPQALATNFVATQTESPAFTGSKLNMDYRTDLAGLALAAVTPVDSIPDIDSVPSWDYAGGVAPLGEYYFATAVDLSDVYTSRVTAYISGTAVDVSDTIDQRTDNADDWLDLDGEFIDDVNAALYMQTTEDDPASGSAEWTEWKPFFVGSYHARGLRFKLQVVTQSAYHNFVIDGLQVTVDMPDRTENLAALSSPASTYHVDFPAPFKVAPAVGIMGHNLISGDYFVIANKTNSGFDITFKNSAGTPVARTFDVLAKGYGRAVS